ncbi:MBL fold metallo-hydrolase [Cellulosimicrobium sp. CUA-896]|uniref:MBL fold metallo-hydrolase n=1 Tax=Cellulosimicrobium sp. CUA-896 TaxID=1517881 RepID=UPI000968C6C4|nr:MBL fold metallo-hydrolase [Cellulosimicrobium sp. CUA-896]OLT51701.1 hypothetical protein BJF88_14775 [Cellulosimicrobium sp. CUA-896]
MRLVHHGHSCVTLHHGHAAVVVDPGTLSDAGAALRDATAVLVTHQHPDHVDVAVLTDALRARPVLEVWAPHDAAAAVRRALPGDDAGRVHVVVPGDGLTLDGVEVLVGGGEHAVVHRDVPRVANVTYLLRADGTTVHHPGDSLDVPGAPGVLDPLVGARLDVLLAPVAAPWLKLAETIDVVRAVDPRVVVPVHDAVLSAAGRGLVDRLLGEARTGGTYDYRPLRPGESLDVPGTRRDG